MKSTLSARLATLALAVSIGGLAGCAAARPGSLTPESTVYATKSGYAVALQVAVAYKGLPACKTPPVLPCSDPALVARLQKADTAAFATLEAAELAVRSGGNTNARDRAIAAAEAAVAAFTSLTSSIGATK